ncbi:MAG: outer membrane lipoprotein-sorting protein [Pseudomonadales bacterium]|nr:outer membrane lipoprotein-sorting protein [Pseudomonadales bacterium]
MTRPERRALRRFRALTAWPRTMLLASLLCVAMAGAGLTGLVKDVSMTAFVPSDHPSALTEARIAEVFGLADPVAIAVMTSDGSSIFAPDHLAVVAALTEAISSLDNVRRDRVTSLSTESFIAPGEDGALVIDRYVPSDVPTRADADLARTRWRAMPPHAGTLVAEDESGTVILAELVDQSRAGDTYLEVRAVADAFDAPGLTLHVAGPGAVSGYLSRYIDGDARVMQPLVFVIVLLFLFAAFRSARALLGPLVVLLGAAAGALGIMAWQGVPYFAITNALPVILVAIAVADAIHVLSQYYQLRASWPEEPVRELVVQSMARMWRPITLTTLTTIAGFVGIALASIMPPITWFAWYAALGVALAWVFSMLALPNAMVLLRLPPSPSFRSWGSGRPDRLAGFFLAVARFSARRPALVLAVFVACSGLALASADRLRIDRSQVENFAPDEPIRLADELLNRRFAGTAFLDVMIETDEPEGLLRAGHMKRIEDLQTYFETLPHVQTTVSIVDYLGLLHGALFPDEPRTSLRELPEEDEAVAQYLFLYEVSGDPTDLEEEIDSGYRTVLVRGVLDSVFFSQTRETVEGLQQYLDEAFAGTGLRASLGGDVNITYHWMSRLGATHFQGVAISLAMVFAMAVLVFRSLPAGFLSILPVTFTVAVIYGLMAAFDVYLEPATSMFAAISLGVGVDFAIHMVDRIRSALLLTDGSLERALELAVPITARASFFNAAALGVGFAVMLFSALPMLQRFGGLVSAAALVSFLVGVAVIPACYAVGLAARRSLLRRANRPAWVQGLRILVLCGLGLAGVPEPCGASDEALRIAENVFERPEGRFAVRTIEMELTDRRGGRRSREAVVLKHDTGDVRMTRITYLQPRTVDGTSFLSHDFRGGEGIDERWLYLPAARRVRQIPASDRGDYFLGTDFTYEDMQSDLKFDPTDYVFWYEGEREVDGRTLHRLSGVPREEQVARELGYGAFVADVDGQSWVPLRIEFRDLDDAPLKTVEVRRLERIDGIWTATEIVATHHQTGHATRFRYRDVRYLPDLPERWFRPASLERRLSPSLLGGR